VNIWLLGLSGVIRIIRSYRDLVDVPFPDAMTGEGGSPVEHLFHVVNRAHIPLAEITIE